MKSRAVGVVVSLVMIFATVTGCASDPLAEQYRQGTNKQYIAGDGTVTEVAAENRGEALTFTGTSETGAVISVRDYRGRVLVVNFWYAACAPCRAEAPALQQLNEKFHQDGVAFLGVNVRDQPETALSFAQSFELTYPSIIDSEGAVQLSFSGNIAANAVPTTVVIDHQGRVAARILGRVEPSILSTLIRTVLDEVG